MVQLSCALEMRLLRVSAIISLGLMTPSLGLRAPGAPKVTMCPPNARITLILTLIFDISFDYGPNELCFGYGTLVGVCYQITRAHSAIIRFRGPWGP